MIGWDKKIARAHDASGIDNISVYIGQTIPEAGTVKGLIGKQQRGQN